MSSPGSETVYSPTSYTDENGIRQEIKSTTYYETLLWRLRNIYEDLEDTVAFLKGEPGTETVVEELQDGMLGVQMAYERWGEFLVTENRIIVAPECLYEVEPETEAVQP